MKKHAVEKWWIIENRTLYPVRETINVNSLVLNDAATKACTVSGADTTM